MHQKNSTIQEYTTFNRLTYFLHMFATILANVFVIALFGLWTPMHILSLTFTSIWQIVITYKRVVDYGGYGVASVIYLSLCCLLLYLPINDILGNPLFCLFYIIGSIYNFIIFIKCLICPSKHKTY